MWVEPAGGWSGVSMTETAQLSDGNTTFADEFGISTAITSNEIIVGAPEAVDLKTGQAYRGAAYVYVEPASGWQTTSKYNGLLLNSDWTANDGFGSSLAAVRSFGQGESRFPHIFYRGCTRRTSGEKLIFKHPWQGQRNALSLGKTMWPHFLQIRRPSATTLMG